MIIGKGIGRTFGAFLALSLICSTSHGLMCDRTPPGVSIPRTVGDGRFEVVVNGDPDKYVPGVSYTVKLHGKEQNGAGAGADQFLGFLLVVEPVDGTFNHQGSAGTFKLKDDSLARFSEFCPDAVKHAAEVAKPEVQVSWTAPPSTAGCVIFRATVIKNANQWYMDDGDLTKLLCPENDDGTAEADYTEPCRACDEAKYEMTFEGLWSSLTHPRGFPSAWTASFSDIIGASHSPNFRFWESEEYASEGMRHVAETGTTNMRYLESELKNQSRNIRTIIKARGLRHSNYNGLKTFAVFRVDRDHNLVSFVSKIDPSPDWFVGVSGVNLCLGNGSWVTNRIIPLYPWDAGTDSGIRYLDPDIPTIPRDRIHKLVWSNDRESPFYDPNGNMVKPFAKLRIQQQRTYKRSSCNGDSSRQSNDYNDDDFYDESPDRDRPECRMKPWSQWAPCSETCGTGIRRRHRTYVNEPQAREFGCNRSDVQEKYCHNAQLCKGNVGSYYDSKPSHVIENEGLGLGLGLSGGGGGGSVVGGYPDEDGSLRDPREDVCGTTEWSPWSTCADPCGKGIRYQYRTFLRPELAAMHGCESQVGNALQKKGRCPITADCPDTAEQVEPGCEVSGWGPWSECPVTCGMGTKTRTRYWKNPGDHKKCKLQMQMFDSCVGALPNCPPERSKEDCLEPKKEGECRNNYTRWYFDQVKMRCLRFEFKGCKKTRNNFDSEEECKSVCDVLIEQLAEHRSKLQSRYGVELSSAFSYMMADDTGTNCENTTTPVRTRHSKHGENSWGSFQAMSPSSRQAFGHSHSSSSHSHYTPHRTSSSHHYLYPSHSSSSSFGNINSNQPVLPIYSDGPAVDCKVSQWSAWSPCSVECGRGWKHQRRYVLIESQNGGRPCPELLEQSRRCKGVNCPPNHPFGRHFAHDDYNYQE